MFFEHHPCGQTLQRTTAPHRSTGSDAVAERNVKINGHQDIPLKAMIVVQKHERSQLQVEECS